MKPPAALLSDLESREKKVYSQNGEDGVIVEAWMRLQDRPGFRASASVRFPGDGGFARGAEAVRKLPQTGRYPSNCRLLDGTEAANSGAGEEPVLCWASSRQTTPSTPGWPARSSAAAMRAGRFPKGRSAPAPTRAPRTTTSVARSAAP